MTENNPPVTKSSLAFLKNELELAQLGYELLDQKRSILIFELIEITSHAVKFENQMDQLFETAYEQLKKTIIGSGYTHLSQIAASVKNSIEITISQRKVMGVTLPTVKTVSNPPVLAYSSLDVPASLDLTYQIFMEVLKEIGKLTEVKVCILRLAVEIKKTVRRVNALEKITIPQSKKIMKLIENRLEENERNMLVLMKNVKKRFEN